jgi:hypothetical protein
MSAIQVGLERLVTKDLLYGSKAFEGKLINSTLQRSGLLSRLSWPKFPHFTGFGLFLASISWAPTEFDPN